MGKIFYIMGKSAVGKDTVYKEILKMLPELKTVVPYTTRPIRTGEQNGKEYYFTSQEEKRTMEDAGKIIECRTYQTMMGPWSYFTVDDGQIDLENAYYLMIGTLESYEKTRAYFGAEALVPVYIAVEDGIRLQRALDREKLQETPRFDEVCRRYLADEEDFSKENIERCGIKEFYDNTELKRCIKEIAENIRHEMSGETGLL